MTVDTRSSAGTFFYIIAQPAGVIAHFPNRQKGILHSGKHGRTGVLNAPSCPLIREEGDATGLQEPASGEQREIKKEDDARPTLPHGKRYLARLLKHDPCVKLSPCLCQQTAESPRWNADRSFWRQVRQNDCTGNPGLNACESRTSLWTSLRTTGSTEPKLRQAGGQAAGIRMRCGELCGRSKIIAADLSAAFIEPCLSLVKERKRAVEYVMTQTVESWKRAITAAEYVMTHTAASWKKLRGVCDDLKTDRKAGNHLPQAVTADRRAQCGLPSTINGTMDALASTGSCSGRQQNEYDPPPAALLRDTGAAAVGSQNTFLKGLETFLSLGRDSTFSTKVFQEA